MLDGKQASGASEEASTAMDDSVDATVQEHEMQEAVPMPPPEAAPYGGGGGAAADDDMNNYIGGEGNGELGGLSGADVDKAKAVLFDNGGYPLLVLIASVVVLISASTRCNDANFCSDKYAFAVAAGVISTIVALLFLFLERKENLAPKVRLGLTVFLFLWWVLVAGLTTFGNVLEAPFAIPGNGYFSAWGGLVVTLLMLSNEVGKVRESIDRFSKVGRPLAVIMIASLVVMFAAVADCDNACSGAEGYAITVGVISFFVSLARVFFESKMSHKASMVVHVFLAVWWSVATLITTFGNPFSAVGNGYFGTWAALISSVLLLKHSNA